MQVKLRVRRWDVQKSPRKNVWLVMYAPFTFDLERIAPCAIPLYRHTYASFLGAISLLGLLVCLEWSLERQVTIKVLVSKLGTSCRNGGSKDKSNILFHDLFCVLSTLNKRYTRGALEVANLIGIAPIRDHS